MALHGSPSPKRTCIWSNMPQVLGLDLGVLTKEEKQRRTSVQTVRKYVNGSGQSRFVGTPALSQSQNLGLILKTAACMFNQCHSICRIT